MNNKDSEFFENRPVTMNEGNNLLQIEEHMYILDDVEKPNGFRNMFPYSEIPSTTQYAQGHMDHGYDIP